MRQIAIALIEHDGHILVGEFMDTVTKQVCYRPLGGGIEPGEESEAAMRRELREEIGAELSGLKLLDTFEAIFTFSGKLRHERVHVFEAELKDERFYKREFRARVRDTFRTYPEVACWMPIEGFQTSKALLLPGKILDYISNAP